MTRRATFTQAELARAIRAAEALGKVAVYTPSGIVFADPATIPQIGPQATRQPDVVEDWFREHGND